VQSDDEVLWDDDDEDDDAGSSAAAKGSGATYEDDGSEELEEQGESLSHSSKSPCPASLRDWSEDDDDELVPSAALEATTLHVAAARGKISPIVDVPDSPERSSAAPKPAALRKPRGEAAAPKKRAQPAAPEPAQKRKKTERAAKDLLPPKVKKVVKCQATAVAG
jgi:hypothetical protein